MKRKSHIIKIPLWHPAPLNKLMENRWKAARLKKASKEFIWWSAKAANTPQATGKRIVTLTIALGKGMRGCDPDAYWKDLLDAMVFAKLLRDDSPKWIELNPVKYLRESDWWGTIIELQDVEAAA